MNKIYLTLIFLLSLHLAQGQEERNAKILSSENYSIAYPENWKLANPEESEANFLLRVNKANEDGVSGNINLLKADEPDLEITLDDLLESSVKELEQFGAVIDDKKRIEAVFPFWQIKLSLVNEGQKLRFIQRYMVVDGYAYVLTFTATQAGYEIFLDDAVSIMDSFKIK